MSAARLARRLVPGVLAAAAIWSLLPVGVRWARTPAAYYAAQWSVWGWGSLVSLGLAALLLVLTRGAVVVRLRAAWEWQMRRIAPRPFALGAAALLGALALLACLVVFEGNPRSVDGFAQLFHARIFLAGRTWLPAPAEMASFGTLHMIVGPERWFSQYPPGQSLLLAAGLAVGRWWALVPLVAAAFALGVWRVARWCADESTARLALLLACVSPFVVLVAGSEMSHLPAAALGVLAAAAATWVDGRRGALAGLAAGLALGAMLAFRPLDAVAAAVPVGLVALLATERRARALGAIAAGGLLGTLPFLWFNRATTGSWTELGYTMLWGPEVRLGFHPVPWGTALTPLRALGMTGVDLHQLNTYLFDLPIPILLVIAVGSLVGRHRLGARDLVPVAGVLSLVALLFFYWHRDVFYGPRLLFGVVPWVLVLAARALVLLARAGGEWRSGATWGAAAATAVGVAFAVGLATITPARLRAYHDSAPVSNLDPERAAREAGIRDAVVLVSDGWGSRLIARMWALGVPVRRSTRLYSAIDACTLDLALEDARRDPARRARLVATLDSLAALRRPGVETKVTEDSRLRLPRAAALGAPLPAPCVAELRLDRAGFLNYPRFLWLNEPSLDGEIVWARDQGGWNDDLERRYPGRRFYRYAPAAPGAPPTFVPLPRLARLADDA